MSSIVVAQTDSVPSSSMRILVSTGTFLTPTCCFLPTPNRRNLVREPALAGLCFFGRGLVCVIESRYRGGGGLMLQWLQSQYQNLIAHQVLYDSSAQFLQRYSFVDIEPPLPTSAQDD